MWSFTKAERLSPEQIEELKSQWFPMEEAIEELAVNGDKITESTFRRRANEVNRDKEFFEIGKPQVKKEKLEGKGRPRKLYNRAFVEALRANAISDTFKKIEEEPIELFIKDNWKGFIEEEFKRTIKLNMKDDKIINLYGLIDDLTELVSEVVEDIILKNKALEAQNKLLVHQNRKLGY